MNTQQKKLTKLEEQIIDALANDYENLEQIRNMLDQPIPDSKIKTTLWTLIQEGYIACYAPTKMTMKIVAHPERQHLDDYWYALTNRGEQLLITLETH